MSLCFEYYQQYKVINIQSLQNFQMQPTNTIAFLGLSNSQNYQQTQNLPCYFYYLSGELPSNIECQTYFTQVLVNNDIIQNGGDINEEHPLKTPESSQNMQVKSPYHLEKNASQNNEQTSTFRILPKTPIKHQKLKRRNSLSSEDQYCPKDSQSFDVKSYKLSQTKNIPKNYEKAIIQFISKNMTFTYKVLEHCGADFAKFMAYYHGMIKNIGSIAKLRSLWIDSQNPYAKVFRIISKEYLRKHSLSYIFNSRVVNISKHIKYRYIIEKSIGDPHSFTHMKQY